jgi:hypothetical protein
MRSKTQQLKKTGSQSGNDCEPQSTPNATDISLADVHADSIDGWIREISTAIASEQSDACLNPGHDVTAVESPENLTSLILRDADLPNRLAKSLGENVHCSLYLCIASTTAVDVIGYFADAETAGPSSAMDENAISENDAKRIAIDAAIGPLRLSGGTFELDQSIDELAISGIAAEVASLTRDRPIIAHSISLDVDHQLVAVAIAGNSSTPGPSDTPRPALTEQTSELAIELASQLETMAPLLASWRLCQLGAKVDARRSLWRRIFSR